MGNLDDLMPGAAPDTEPEAPSEPEAPAPERKPSVKKRAKKELAPEPESPSATEDNTPSLGDLIERNELGLTSKAKAYKKYLSEQPLVEIMIPYMPGDDGRSVMDFNGNSFSFSVPKGRYVLVPQDVAKRIAETLEADRSIVNGHPLNLVNRPEARSVLNHS